MDEDRDLIEIIHQIELSESATDDSDFLEAREQVELAKERLAFRHQLIEKKLIDKFIQIWKEHKTKYG